MTTFKDLNIIAPILTSLEEKGYQHPTPIQAQAIPHVLSGTDLLGCAQTGTGKTAAFAIPILQLLQQKKVNHKGIRALVLTPTRELAIQIDENFKEYSRHLKLTNAVIFGGVNQFSQVQQLKRGVDVLVATPGRLLDLMGQKIISIDKIEIFVLDEADRMLDMGFINDVKKLLQVLPKKRQTLFFSATMPKVIQSLADNILTHPVKVEVTPESTTAETIKQALYYVDKPNKNRLLSELLKKDIDDSVLVFTRTKHGADRLVKYLMRLDISSAAIHGNKSQNQRQSALDKFKNKEIKVLVATDIAARGIDIELLKYVVNYEIPNIPESYVHRIGRSGRAGASGIAISFCDPEEIPYIQDIQKTISLAIPVKEFGDLTIPHGVVMRLSNKTGKADGVPAKVNTNKRKKPTSKERRRHQA